MLKMSLTNVSSSEPAVGCWPESAISNDALKRRSKTNYFIAPCITTEDHESKFLTTPSQEDSTSEFLEMSDIIMSFPSTKNNLSEWQTGRVGFGPNLFLSSEAPCICLDVKTIVQLAYIPL
jgi:hypothetical protein